MAGAAILVLGRSRPMTLTCLGEGEHMCGGGLGRRHRRGEVSTKAPGLGLEPPRVSCM